MDAIRQSADSLPIPAARVRAAEPAAAVAGSGAVETGRSSVPKAGPSSDTAPTLEAMRESFRESVEAANERLSSRGTSISMAIDKATDTVIVQIKDQQSGDTVRQIPSQQALQISRNIERLTGIMIDQKV
jgi:flagellar protein FlaG